MRPKSAACPVKKSRAVSAIIRDESGVKNCFAVLVPIVSGAVPQRFISNCSVGTRAANAALAAFIPFTVFAIALLRRDSFRPATESGLRVPRRIRIANIEVWKRLSLPSHAICDQANCWQSKTVNPSAMKSCDKLRHKDRSAYQSRGYDSIEFPLTFVLI